MSDGNMNIGGGADSADNANELTQLVQQMLTQM